MPIPATEVTETSMQSKTKGILILYFFKNQTCTVSFQPRVLTTLWTKARQQCWEDSINAHLKSSASKTSKSENPRREYRKTVSTLLDTLAPEDNGWCTVRRRLSEVDAELCASLDLTDLDLAFLALDEKCGRLSADTNALSQAADSKNPEPTSPCPC